MSIDSKNESDNNRSSHDIVFRQLKREIQWRISRGQAVLVSECWVRFKDLCEEHSLSVPYYFESRRAFFRYKLTQLLPNISVIPRQGTDLGDDLIISSSLSLPDVCDILTENSKESHDLKLPAYNENEMMQMVHVALYLRRHILQHPLNTKAELTEELYVFIALMYGGSDVLESGIEDLFQTFQKAASVDPSYWINL